MFDPSVSIYAAMILTNLTTGINDGAYQCGPLYITVNSKTAIILNWDFYDCSLRIVPDKINLYLFKEDGSQILNEAVTTKDIMRGSYTTDFHFPKNVTHFPYGWGKNDVVGIYGSHCLPLVIESSLNAKVIDRRCLRIYPSWMQKYGTLRIGEMMIPGTHNSGAWTGVPQILNNYVFNQDRDLYEQLVFGQRYFDIRVGITPDDNRIYITHNVVRTSLFDEELDHIAKFTKKSPGEIIIIDIHKFNRPSIFSEKEHAKVLKVIQDKLGNYLIPKSFRGRDRKGPRLRELWKSNRSIIVAYRNLEMVAKKEFLWPPIKRHWGNKIEPDALLAYMIEITESKPRGNPMQVLMAELTPNLKYILKNPLKGLGLLADVVNEELTFWMRDFNITQNINIIATDYFLGTQMTELALEENDNRVMHHVTQKRKKLEKFRFML